MTTIYYKDNQTGEIDQHNTLQEMVDEFNRLDHHYTYAVNKEDLKE